jgi:phosphatidylinositol 4-kinase
VLNNLRRRFNLGATEEECVEIMLSMISDSMDAWSTRQYDFYQRVLNGIL